MIYILPIIKTFLLSWIITRYEPLHTYIIGTLEGFNRFLFKNNTIIGQILASTKCMKCVSLVTGFIMTQNIYLAIIASIIGFHFDRWEGKQKINF